ncbi:MAG: cell volume regulation protein A [bacterium]|nr:MAG: cell volume regulation protein A [bacterium]KAF0149337.1 MAG: cell volume regulation protein A [bacterium]KAF0169859.1 MAG: cell volume regulation protein A [bacterium]TXT18556.1 MAG: cell volume regulation protein A [bacterium]
MDLINQLVLAGAALLLLAILASALSYRIGMPLLLVFLAVGMLAGEDGPGGIVFNDAGIAYTVGSVALAVILLDGGLNTRTDSFRAGLRPAFVLATAGVLLTCLVTGLFAAWLLDFGLLEGLLVGAVVGSTDAAAVFALLRAKGLNLKQRVSATLEIESGSNDPMAVFLTIAILELLLAGKSAPDLGMLELFTVQMGMGLLAGLAGGRLLAWLTNRLPLEAGMYPMLVLAGGLALYGVTTVLGGSGFLAIYLAGVVFRHRAPRKFGTILQVHNGLAWLAQLGMFLMLGLLATPSKLLEHALPALAIALALMFLARPLAVWLCLLPFNFPRREQVFIAWVGLRGAVPIILALFPLLAGLPEAPLILEVAFFVVLISLTLQGWTIPGLARRLRLEVPAAPEPGEHLQLAGGGGGEHAVLGYRLAASAPAVHHSLEELRLPADAWPLTVLRDGAPLRPQQAGKLRAGDWLYLMARESDNTLLADLLAPAATPSFLQKRQFYGDFIVHGDAGLDALAEHYGFALPELPAGVTLAEFLAGKLRGLPVAGDRVRLGKLEFVVREVDGGRIQQVGLRIPTHLD